LNAVTLDKPLATDSQERFNHRMSEEELADHSTAMATDIALAAIRAQAAKPIEASPVCLNCGQPTHGRRWCDIDCQKDWSDRTGHK